MGTVAKGVSVEQYLSDPEYRHYEYIDGELLELNVGGLQHSKIQANITYFLTHYLRERKLAGFVATEMHCRIRPGKFYLPDVAVVLNYAAAEQRFLERAPDLVVEIVSPGDTIAAAHRKVADYFGAGCRLAWIVLADERSVLVSTPGAAVRAIVPGEMLDGGDVLPGFEVQIDELFV